MKRHEVIPGVKVHYHPVIGRAHDGQVYVVLDVQEMPSGNVVAWLEHKRGCVDIRALSPAESNQGENA